MSPAQLWRRLQRPIGLSLRLAAHAYDATRQLGESVGRALGSATVAVSVGGAALAGLGITAGYRLGPAALLLCLPAAGGAVFAHRRFTSVQAGRALVGHLDPVTGAGSAQQLRERLRYEVLRHTRRQRRLSVLVLHSEVLGQVHQDYGRVAGQEAVRMFSRQLERVLRAEDTLARIGRYQFAILMPEAGWREADALSDRLHTAVQAMSTRLGNDLSVGFAVFPEHGTSPEVLLANAARAAADAAAPPAQSRPALRRVA